MNEIDLKNQTKIIFESSGAHHFFGYYDKCPWSKDGRFLLAHETDFIDHLPDGKEAARIGFFDLAGGGHFQKLAETRAWNWQQGSMLQWLGPDYKSRVIFNDLKNNEFVSFILDVRTGEKKEISFPVYALHPGGHYALSVNFSRLDELREGYGYKGVRDLSASEEKPRSDGIYIVDFETRVRRLAVSLAQLCELRLTDSMNEGKHWVDHLTFNPKGTQCAFLHRWQLKNGGMHSRFCVADLGGKEILGVRILLDSGMVSHFTWKSDTELLAWARPAGTITSISGNRIIRKIFVPIYHSFFGASKIRQKISGDACLLFNINDKTGNYFKRKVGEGVIVEDGHNSFSPDGQWLITDTYPNKSHWRNLSAFHLADNRLFQVGDFYSLPDDVVNDWDLSALRCDLHPRWNRSDAQICIDSVHEGSRQMYVLDIKNLID